MSRIRNFIVTTGAGAIGLAGQSIGGGGGSSGVTGDRLSPPRDPCRLSPGASTTGGGKGGSAIINEPGRRSPDGGSAAIPASGDGGAGLLGQSIGGGGGSAIYALGVVTGSRASQPHARWLGGAASTVAAL